MSCISGKCHEQHQCRHIQINLASECRGQFESLQSGATRSINISPFILAGKNDKIMYGSTQQLLYHSSGRVPFHFSCILSFCSIHLSSLQMSLRPSVSSRSLPAQIVPLCGNITGGQQLAAVHLLSPHIFSHINIGQARSSSEAVWDCST